MASNQRSGKSHQIGLTSSRANDPDLTIPIFFAPCHIVMPFMPGYKKQEGFTTIKIRPNQSTNYVMRFQAEFPNCLPLKLFQWFKLNILKRYQFIHCST